MKTHVHTKKPSSSWTPAALQTQSHFGPHPFPDLTKKPNSESVPTAKEISDIGAKDELRHANVMRTYQDRAQEAANLNQVPEGGQQELNSTDSQENEQTEQSRTSSPNASQGNPFKPSSIMQKAAAMMVQQRRDRTEHQRVGPAAVSPFKIQPAAPQNNSSVIQTKLTIGEPNDKYEIEADRVAAQVVNQINSPTPATSQQGQSVQRNEELKEEEPQAKLEITALQRQPKLSSIQREETPEDEDKELQTKSLLQRGEATGAGEATTDIESTINSAIGVNFHPTKICSHGLSHGLLQALI